MLVTCPECTHEISDKATTCPSCGYPLKAGHPYRRRRKQRLPNGFGRITEIRGGNLREPFRVMITVGKDQYGHPIGKLLKPKGYFKTYNEAYMALAEYRQNPYDLNSAITFEELYEKWSEKYFKSLNSESSKRTVTAAWHYCDSIKSMQAITIRARHLKNCIDNAEFNGKQASERTKSRIKSLFNLMFDYAVEYELTDKNYARSFNFDIPDAPDKEHIAYENWEIKKLWKNINIPYANFVLIQCYSGWRPIELCKMKLADVDLENWFFNGGVKTEAGKNRTVPIHSCIRDLVKEQYLKAKNINSETLFFRGNTGEEMSYDYFRPKYNKLKEALELNPKHRAHDGRKFFITIAKAANVNDYALKMMVGHTITDLTEKVYTERSNEWLRKEIEKIKGAH